MAQPGKKSHVLTYIIIVAIIVALGWLFVRAVQKRIPAGEDLSAAYEIVSRDHIEVGAAHDPYNSNPPTSGPHYVTTAALGFYDLTDEIPADEYIIHNLEHGEIWITYRPALATSTREALSAFGNEPLVIVTPRAANDTDIALVAWGRVEKFDLGEAPLDLERIKGFILRHKNRGPEKVTPSEHR